MNKDKAALMYAIWNDKTGFYVGTHLRRAEMIAAHCAALGLTWQACKARGDKVVKVWITAVDNKAGA